VRGYWAQRRLIREDTSHIIVNIPASMVNIRMHCRDHVCKTGHLCRMGYDLTTFHVGLRFLSNKGEAQCQQMYSPSLVGKEGEGEGEDVRDGITRWGAAIASDCAHQRGRHGSRRSH